MGQRKLVILACSSRKAQNAGPSPALARYDGPIYRVLRSFLREHEWPSTLSIGILSARYGLIGCLAPIEYYDQRMTRERALELRPSVSRTLSRWLDTHDSVDLVLGKDYLRCIDPGIFVEGGTAYTTIPGPIGYHLQHLRNVLHERKEDTRRTVQKPSKEQTLYFLPDWDDFLDRDFDFDADRFSAKERSRRNEVHCIEAMQPKTICDGVLVSLAQLNGGKGLLRSFRNDSTRGLAPVGMHHEFGLDRNELAFGDCGAFSYVAEEVPPLSADSAAALYEAYGFDLGSSVDHIPVPEVPTPNGKRKLTEKERRTRVAVTHSNAADFIRAVQEKRYGFDPVGVIQGLTPRDYARQVSAYAEMGYRKLALGGLVPLKDSEIVEVVDAVGKAARRLPEPITRELWVHLFGVFRPRIQSRIHRWPVVSFDSSTYFRKAWLRSDQNYLGSDGRWYASVRVPMTSDPRTRKKILDQGIDLVSAQAAESKALEALRRFAANMASVDETLSAVCKWDSMLKRGQATDAALWRAYRNTLTTRVWEMCDCPVCKDLGVHVVIFRGYNRNKRRGAHNTYQLYGSLTGSHKTNVAKQSGERLLEI